MYDMVKKVRVRKAHECWNCGHIFNPGDEALSFFATDCDFAENGRRSGYACTECAAENNITETPGNGMRWS